MSIKGYRVGPLLKKTGREIVDDNVLGLAAGLAYNFFFSLFPICLFLAPMLALIGDKRETFNFLLDRLSGALPADAFQLMRNVIAQVVFEPNAPGLVSIGALLALWSGSNIFSSIMDALNAAYDIDKDSRPWWKRRLIAIACLLGVGALFVLSTIVLLAGDDIVQWIADHVGLGQTGRVVWMVVQFPLALAIIVATGYIVYRYLPDVRQNKWHALVGSVVATLLWVVVTMAFRFYVQNFGNYNKTYGTIGGVIVLLTWMYLSMVVLLAGGELAAELMHGTGATRTRTGHLYGGRISNGGPTDSASVDHVERVGPYTPSPAFARGNGGDGGYSEPH